MFDSILDWGVVLSNCMLYIPCKVYVADPFISMIWKQHQVSHQTLMLLTLLNGMPLFSLECIWYFNLLHCHLLLSVPLAILVKSLPLWQVPGLSTLLLMSISLPLLYPLLPLQLQRPIIPRIHQFQAHLISHIF